MIDFIALSRINSIISLYPEGVDLSWCLGSQTDVGNRERRYNKERWLPGDQKGFLDKREICGETFL